MTNSVFALIRATRGPVVLITLGALFAVDQMQGIGFRRTWPVLVIVFGVMKLAERLLAPPVPPPAVYFPPASGPWVQQPPPPTGQGDWKP